MSSAVLFQQQYEYGTSRSRGGDAVQPRSKSDPLPVFEGIHQVIITKSAIHLAVVVNSS